MFEAVEYDVIAGVPLCGHGGANSLRISGAK